MSDHDALPQAPLLALPEAGQEYLLNGRTLSASTIQIGQQVFPDNGVFQWYFNKMLAEMRVAVDGEKLVLTQPHRPTLIVAPTQVTVLVAPFDYNSRIVGLGSGSHPGPIYRTVLQAVTPQWTCFISIIGALGAQALVLHPGALPVQDPLGLAQMPVFTSDYPFNDYLNALPFAALVKRTKWAFLADMHDIELLSH